MILTEATGWRESATYEIASHDATLATPATPYALARPGAPIGARREDDDASDIIATTEAGRAARSGGGAAAKAAPRPPRAIAVPPKRIGLGTTNPSAHVVSNTSITVRSIVAVSAADPG